MKIGELAKKSGVTTRTIRYYEELGIINPSSYSDGGFRLYSENELLKLKMINLLKEMDFSLEEIKEITYLYNKSNDISESLFNNTVKIFNNKISNYNDLENELNKNIEYLQFCSNCNKKPCYENCTECSEIPDGEMSLILKSVL